MPWVEYKILFLPINTHFRVLETLMAQSHTGTHHCNAFAGVRRKF